MAIIISNTIQKKELGKGKISESDKAVLKRTARLELVSPIKGEGLPKGAKIVKAYGTSIGGAKRVVYMLTSDNEDFMLLFYRDKNDAIGKNITIANPIFKKEISKRIDLLLADLEDGKYSVL